MIAKLFEAGADVFRLNMSHLPRERLRERVELIRGVEAKFKRPIAILADLQGPKLRVGIVRGDGAMLVSRRRPSRSMPTRRPATRSASTCPTRKSCPRSSPATRSSSTTASCGCAVEEVKAGTRRHRVEVAGKISNRKGVSLPDTEIPVAAMTEKDRSDLEAALDAGVDWIALSFVQRPEDVAEVQEGRARPRRS